MTSRITNGVLLKVFFRSFLLQASWNFERMQNLGALFVLAPALRRLYDRETLPAAFRRHLAYFNTHPYMACPVLGASLALEDKAARGESGSLGVEEFKGMIMAPYAAMGDAFFWGGMRPLAAGVGLFFAAKGSLWAPLVFLLFFNLPHLWLRGVGLFRGFRLGVRVVDIIQRHRIPDLAVRCKEATIVLLGAFSAYLVFQGAQERELAGGWGLLLMPLMVGLVVLVRRGWSTLFLVLSGAGLVLALTGLLM